MSSTPLKSDGLTDSSFAIPMFVETIKEEKESPNVSSIGSTDCLFEEDTVVKTNKNKRVDKSTGGLEMRMDERNGDAPDADKP